MNKLTDGSNRGVQRCLTICALFAALILVMCQSSQAATVTLAWDPSTDPEVTGYRLYCAHLPETEFQVFEVGGETAFTIPDLVEGETYAFYVTCYNTVGLESEPSNTIDYTVPALPISEVRITQSRIDDNNIVITWSSVAGATYRVVYKTDIADPDWQTLGDDLTGSSTETTFTELIPAEPGTQRFYAITQVTP